MTHLRFRKMSYEFLVLLLLVENHLDLSSFIQNMEPVSDIIAEASRKNPSNCEKAKGERTK
jgi:hypothetical protein